MKTERQYLSVFKTYIETAALLCEDRIKQIRIADEVFKLQNGFSWLGRFEQAFKKVIGKDFILVPSGADLAERHKTKEKTSQGLNKGKAPKGFMNKGDLIAYMNKNFNCPASLIEALLERFEKLIKQKSYGNEVEICGKVKIVNVPCYRTSDCITILKSICNSAVQKKTKKQRPSVMCHFPVLGMDFRFNLEAFRAS